MIAASDDELEIRHSWLERVKCFDHEFEPFVSTPFPKGQNAVRRSSATREIRELGPTGQQSVSAEMNIVAAVLIVQDLAISGHQDRN